MNVIKDAAYTLLNRFTDLGFWDRFSLFISGILFGAGYMWWGMGLLLMTPILIAIIEVNMNKKKSIYEPSQKNEQ